MAGAPGLAAGGLASYKNNVADRWYKDPGLIKLHLIIAAVFLCPITSGFDNSLLNNLQVLPTFLKAMGNPSASTLGVLGSFGSVGQTIGVFPAFLASDHLGRKWCMTLGSLGCMIGLFLQTFATNIEMFIAGRAFIGGAVNMLIISGASYVNEIAHPAYRGRIGGFFNVTYYIGAIIASGLCYGIKQSISSNWQWKLPVLLQIVPACWTFCLGFWLPESPRWLISKGRHEEAAATLFKYHANGDTSDEMVLHEIQEITETMALEREVQAKVTWKHVFTGAGNRRRILVMVLFATSISWTSQSISSYYNASIYKQAGITGVQQQLGLNLGFVCMDFVVAGAGAYASGFVTRRFMLFLGFGGMLFSHVFVTAFAATYYRTSQANIGYGIVAFLWIESAFYNFGLNPITYLYPAELMSFALRAKGIALFLGVADTWSVITRYTNPVGLANLNWRYYIIYLAIYVFTLLGIYFFYPETKNKTLEEIEVMLDGTNPDFISNPAVETVRLEGGNETPSVDEEKK